MIRAPSSTVRLWLAIALSIVFVIAAVGYSTMPIVREAGIFKIVPPTPYFHYSNGTQPRGRVLVVHGLDANKGMMNIMSYGLAEAGFEVFAIDLPGHGSSTVPFNAVGAREAVARVLEQLGDNTNVLGHSLGGALLLDVASDHPVRNMVLFSPAPVAVEHVQCDHILVFTGQFDVGRIGAFGPHLNAALDGVEFHQLAWTGHSGALTKPGVIRKAADFFGSDSSQVRTPKRLVLLLAMVASSLGLWVSLIWTPRSAPPVVEASVNTRIIFLRYMCAGGIALVVLSFLPVTKWLHLFATDYVIGFQFLTGSVLCAIWRPAKPSATARHSITAMAAAALLIAVLGFAISGLAQVTLPDGRWWRFPAIALLSLPFFLADEIFLRRKSAFALLLTRLILGAMLLTSTLIWNRQYAFLLFIVHFILIFWIALWFLGEFVHRRTRDRFATALFMSIVQGWFFAAIFVTT